MNFMPLRRFRSFGNHTIITQLPYLIMMIILSRYRRSCRGSVVVSDTRDILLYSNHCRRPTMRAWNP